MKKTDLDWNNLGFGYHPTHYNLRCYYRNGKWGEIEKHTDENFNIHMAATALHYGQEAFEGLKAFACEDGRVRIFRPEANAERMARTAEYILMEPPPVELFIEMVKEVVKLNMDFVPSYESGGSLYIRPLLIGTGPQVGVKPAKEYLLLMFVTPVGSYYSGGMEGIATIIDRKHDRAAPCGTGHVKVGGNYAASLKSAKEGEKMGYSSVMYLDPKEHKYIDECGAANFFGIRENEYVTPSSNSVLPSITNMSIRQIAADMGMTVECRDIPLADLETFTEAGSCGTAAVITPIASIYDPETERTYRFGWVGPWTQKLYDRYRAIQLGKVPDPYGWVTVI